MPNVTHRKNQAQEKSTNDRKKERGCCFAVRDFVAVFPGATPEQKQVLIYLALFADADGSNIRPGFSGLTALGIHRRKIKPAIEFWLSLRALILVRPGTTGPYGRAAEYRINVKRLMEFGSTVEPNSPGNSVPTSEPNSDGNSVPTLELNSEQSSVPDSVPNHQEFGTKRPGVRFHSGTTQEHYNGNNKITGAEEEGGSPNGSLAATAAAMSDQMKTAFESLQSGTNEEPFGSLAFKIEFTRVFFSYRPEYNILHENFPDLLEAVIHSCQLKGIKIPKPFYFEKQFAEVYRNIRNEHIFRPAQTQTP